MEYKSDEQRLLVKCRRGDRTAFEEVYNKYTRIVYRHAYHLLGSGDEADDVMQETFVRAYRSFPEFRGDCSIHTWLLKVAGNLCRDRIKQRVRRGDVPLNLDTHYEELTPDAWEQNPAVTVEREDMHRMIYRVLDGLPAAQREMIVLRDLDELSYQEIAEVIGCTVAGVKLRLFRARKSLRTRMEALLQG